MNPIFEVSLTPHCNFKCDYCIASTIEFVSAKNDKTGETTLGWLFPTTKKEDSMILQPDGEYKVQYSPMIWQGSNGNETEEKCIARNRKNKQPPVIGTPDGVVAMNLQKLVLFIQTHLSGWDIVLSGGEPLIVPGIDECIAEITKTNNVKLLSNCFLIKKHKNLLLNPRVAIKVGYHPEFRNHEEFKEKMEFMKLHTDRFYVNFVKHPRMEKDNFKSFFKYKKILEDLEVKYDVTMFKGKWEGKSYGTLWEDEEIAGMPLGKNKEHISEHSLDPLTKDNFMWNPGKTFMTAYADGRILECHNAVVEMGNINDNTLNIEPDGFRKELGCISGARCQCDSMNGYRYMNKACGGCEKG
jgi:hypothetical protein